MSDYTSSTFQPPPRRRFAEINAAGGVLHGRPLQVVIKDHRSIPARGIRNIQEFAAMPDLVAVFGGRFSPVVIEELPTLRATQTLFMAPWSSADAIVDNDMRPNYVFRLSLRDSLAMPRLLEAARRRGLKRVGLLLTNTSWGCSNAEAANLVREVAALPKEQRLPLLSHWGVTGGDFAAQAGPALRQVDLSVIQTFSFFRADGVLVPADD